VRLKIGGKSTRIGVYKCYQCRKRLINSNQLHRALGLTLKTAWFMSHRIREAMRIVGLPPMGGEDGIIEADEMKAKRHSRRLSGKLGRPGRPHRNSNSTLPVIGVTGMTETSISISAVFWPTYGGWNWREKGE
jgi:hypothetical protein